MGMYPLREHVIDDHFGGRAHDQQLFQFLAAAIVRPDFGRETFDVLGLLCRKLMGMRRGK